MIGSNHCVLFLGHGEPESVFSLCFAQSGAAKLAATCPFNRGVPQELCFKFLHVPLDNLGLELHPHLRWKKQQEYESEAEEGSEEVKPTKKKVKKPKAKTTSKPSTQHGAYSPGSYAEARKKFIADRRGQGVSHAAASAAWNISEQRNKLLEGLSPAERKRRRFT